MAEIKPFRCIRPSKEAASAVAALPYDVYDRKEAKEIVKKNPLSFLAVDRAETQFEDGKNPYAPEVYEQAARTLKRWQQEGILTEDESPFYYLYELVMEGRAQTGIVACASVDDYSCGVIARHENTREEKEQDRICHVDVTNAHTGPIFLAYRSQEELNGLVALEKKKTPLYDFISEDGICHRVWKIEDPQKAEEIHRIFSGIPRVYIADGHHRAASAVKVAAMRREANPSWTGNEEFNYFLSVLFPDDQLMIMPYNRVVQDLNGLTREEFLKKTERYFVVTERGRKAFSPEQKGQVGMYLDGSWYQLDARPEICTDDPVEGLDVSILQDRILGPLLGIGDPRTDSGAAVAFSMYPTSIRELFEVADAGLLMPPKSTWFEPKLRSGLFIHAIEK